MYQKQKKDKISIHIISALCAFLLCLGVVLFTRYSVGEAVPSRYYDDQSMPEDSVSVLDTVSLRAENSWMNNLRVFTRRAEPDPQLVIRFKGGKKQNVHSVGFSLKESFPYDLNCVLYYPNRDGNFDEECIAEFTLPQGEKTIYFEVPEDVDYSMRKLRVDINDDYEIGDILISESEIVCEYRPLGHYNVWSAVIYFFVLLIIFELFFKFLPVIRQCIDEFKRKTNITALLLIIIGAPVAGVAAAFCVFSVVGKDFSWFWVLLISLCSMIVAYQLYLLRGKGPEKQPPLKGLEAAKKQIVFWGSISVFCLLIWFEWYDCSGDIEGISETIRFQFPIMLAVAETVLLALLFRKYVLDAKEKSISFLNTYIFVFFLVGLEYMLVFLPFVSPDETTHYLSAYRVSNLLLGKTGELGDNRLLMRMEDFSLYDQCQLWLNSEYYKRITENTALFAKESGLVVVKAPMVTNAIFSYLSTGVGIAIARIFHLSAVMTFHAGRFANLILYTLVLRYLMKKIPFGRTALFAISMMPMTLHMVGSYSYDTSTFCFVALFVTQVMCMICSPEKISRRDYHLCIIFGMLMAPSKLVFLPLLFMVLLIPADKLGGSLKDAWRKRLVVIGTGIGSMVVIMLVVNIMSADSALRSMVNENATVNMLSWAHEPGYTISWILGHIGEYILMCVRTIILKMDYYFFTMLGSSLGWLSIDIPQVYVVAFFIIYLLAVNIRDDVSEQVKIGSGKKGWILLLSAGTVLLTFLAMTLDWTPLSYNFINGVQGRYFLPLLVSGIWLLKNRMIAVDSGMRKYIVFFSTILNVWILVYIFAHCIVAV